MKLIGAGAAVAAMLTAIGASSFAEFTASSSSSAQTFTAGTVKIEVSGPNASYVETEKTGSNYVNVGIDTPSNMSPGDTWTAPFTAKNTGSLPELFTVGSTAVSGSLFSGSTPATVTYSMGSTTLTANDYIFLKPGQSVAINVAVHLPYAAGNTYQGVTGSFTMTASAQQSDNTPVNSPFTVVNPPSSGT